MTVKDLRTNLDKFNDDHQVVMSSNAHGNEFSPLEEVEESHYTAMNKWKGRVDDDPAKKRNAVVLWPTN